MYLSELVNACTVKDCAPSSDEIVLLPAGVRPNIDLSMVVSREAFEQILIKYRAFEPSCEAVMMTIGKKHDLDDPVWGALLQSEYIISAYSRLCEEFFAAKLKDLEESGEGQEEDVETVVTDSTDSLLSEDSDDSSSTQGSSEDFENSTPEDIISDVDVSEHEGVEGGLLGQLLAVAEADARDMNNADTENEAGEDEEPTNNTISSVDETANDKAEDAVEEGMTGETEEVEDTVEEAPTSRDEKELETSVRDISSTDEEDMDLITASIMANNTKREPPEVNVDIAKSTPRISDNTLSSINSYLSSLSSPAEPFEESILSMLADKNDMLPDGYIPPEMHSDEDKYPPMYLDEDDSSEISSEQDNFEDTSDMRGEVENISEAVEAGESDESSLSIPENIPENTVEEQAEDDVVNVAYSQHQAEAVLAVSNVLNDFKDAVNEVGIDVVMSSSNRTWKNFLVRYTLLSDDLSDFIESKGYDMEVSEFCLQLENLCQQLIADNDFDDVNVLLGPIIKIIYEE